MRKSVICLGLVICSACGGNGIPSQTFQTDPVGDVSGRVLNIADGQPISGAEVKVGDRFSVADSNGAYKIIDLPIGQHALNAEADGFQTFLTTVTVQGTATVFDIFLAPTLGPNCTDRDGDGYGVGSDCLGADCDDGDRSKQTGCTPPQNPCASVTCGPGEQCVATGQQTSCECVATYARCGAACIPETAECPAGCQDADMDGYGVGDDCIGWDCDDRDPNIQAICPMGGTGSITGIVALDPEGAAVSGVVIRIAGIDAAPDASGRFTVRDVPSGNHTLEIILEPYFPVRIPNLPIIANSTYDAGTITLSLDYPLGCSADLYSTKSSPDGNNFIIRCSDDSLRGFQIDSGILTPMTLPSAIADRSVRVLDDNTLVAWELLGPLTDAKIEAEYFRLAPASSVATIEIPIGNPNLPMPAQLLSADGNRVAFEVRNAIYLMDLNRQVLETVVDAPNAPAQLIGWDGDTLVYFLGGPGDGVDWMDGSGNEWTTSPFDLRAYTTTGTTYWYQSTQMALLLEAWPTAVSGYQGVVVLRDISSGQHSGDSIRGIANDGATIDLLLPGTPDTYVRIVHVDPSLDLVLFAETDTPNSNGFDILAQSSISPFTALKWLNVRTGQSGTLVTGDGSSGSFGALPAISCLDFKEGDEILCKQGHVPFPIGEAHIWRVNLATLAADSLASYWLIGAGNTFGLGPAPRTYYETSSVNNTTTVWAYRQVGQEYLETEVVQSGAVEWLNREGLLFSGSGGAHFKRLVPGVNLP